MGMSSMFCGMAPAPGHAPATARRAACRPCVNRLNCCDQDLGRAREGLLRRDGAVRLDLDGQLVVVGHLADAGVLDVVVDLAHGREDGVHGDDADGHLLGALGGQVAHAPLDGEVHLDGGAVRVEGQQLLVRVDDLDVGGLHDVRGGDGAGAVLDQLELDGMGRVALEAQLLDVEEDLGRRPPSRRGWC